MIFKSWLHALFFCSDRRSYIPEFHIFNGPLNWRCQRLFGTLWNTLSPNAAKNHRSMKPAEWLLSQQLEENIFV